MFRPASREERSVAGDEARGLHSIRPTNTNKIAAAPSQRARFQRIDRMKQLLSLGVTGARKG
jgi:hypothetical protein